MGALLLVLSLFLGSPSLVLAHAQLRAADPAVNAVVDEMPGTITLIFNEPVTLLVLRWIAPGGATSDLTGDAQNERVTLVPPAGLGDGTHFLSWRVVSIDGHPVGGSYSFHVGAPSAQPASAVELSASAARGSAVARAVLSISLCFALGTVLLPLLVTRTAPDRMLRRSGLFAVALGVVASVALLGTHGLDLLLLAPSALLSAAPWMAVRSTSLAFGVAMSMVALLFAALALLQANEDKLPRTLLALSAWALGAVSFAMVGHAATAEPQLIARAALVVHGATLLFWMGALWPLLHLVRRPHAAAMLARFSALAVPLVTLLVVSGGMLTWLQAGSLAVLAGSTWGLILMVKLGLVVVLLGLALHNRLVLTPAVAAGGQGASSRLARAIRAEIVLGLCILVLASCFRLTPPPRALVEPSEPLYAHIHSERAMADIRMTPGRAGPVEIALGFQTGDLAALVPREVEVILALPEAGIEPIRLRALPGGDSLWHAEPVTLPRPGNWEVSLRLLITDFESVTLRDTLIVPD